MTTLKPEHRSAWRRAASVCGAMLVTVACSPAGNSAPGPAPAISPAAPADVDSAADTVVGPAPVAPTGPAAAAPAAPSPVVNRPTAPSPSSSASPPAPATPNPPAAVTPVRAGLPAGPGRETVQQVCTGCHAIGMVTANGRTSDGWAEMIERMMGLGMEASDEDLQTVHAYLTREFPPRPAN